MPTDFMRAPPIGSQPECDHTPEKRSATSFFHPRPHPSGHVTTFPQSADTNGGAETTSHFSSGGNPSAWVRSRRRNVAQSLLPSVWLVRNRLRPVRGVRAPPSGYLTAEGCDEPVRVFCG